MAGRDHHTRLALCGAGWAATVHTLAAATIRGVGFATVSAETIGDAEELAHANGARPRTAAALPDGSHGVVVATPTHTHAALALDMIAAGTPVLIEQPLSATLAEADAIIDAATESGVVACYAENLLFAPAVDVAINRRSMLGPLSHLQVALFEPPPSWVHDSTGAQDSTRWPGGVLLHLGAHGVAMALALAGEQPVGVRAVLESNAAPVDDVARVELRFESDLIAIIDLGWVSASSDWSAQASSDSGVVRVELQPHVSVELNGEPLEIPQTPLDIDERVIQLGFRAQLEGFASVLEGQGGRVCPVGFGRAVLDVICGAYRSAGEGSEEISLPFDGPRDLTPLQLWRHP